MNTRVFRNARARAAPRAQHAAISATSFNAPSFGRGAREGWLLTVCGADGSRSSNHSSGSWTPDDLNSNPTANGGNGSGEASPLIAAGTGGRVDRCWSQVGGGGEASKEGVAATTRNEAWRPGSLSIHSLLA